MRFIWRSPFLFKRGILRHLFDSQSIMKSIQWVLTTLCLLSILMPRVTKWEGVLFFVIAAIVICPLVDSLIEKRLSWLKSRARRIFLSVAIWYVGAGLAVGSVVSFSNVKVCTMPIGDVCENQEVAFLETTEQISISMQFAEGERSEQVKITLNYLPEPNKESEVLRFLRHRMLLT